MYRLTILQLTLAAALCSLAACSGSGGRSNPTVDASCSTGGTECPSTGDGGGGDSGVVDPDGSGIPMDGGSTGSTGGGSTGSSGTSGGGSTGDAGPCPGCASGLCLDSGVCIECTADTPCKNAALKCDLVSGACVECLRSADECPAGKYCDAGQTCIAGCKNAASCGSGVCDANHECTHCLGDLECGAGRVCGTFECGETCGGVGDPSCAVGSPCCGDQCTDIKRDVEHCGDCATRCSDSQFCGSVGGSTGCTEAVLSNFCKNYKGAVVLDGASGDDAESAILLPKLANGCSPPLAMRFVNQDAADVLNPLTGQPVAGGNDVLVTIGSAYSNRLVRYLETNRIAPVYQVNIDEPVKRVEFRHRGTDALLLSTDLAGETDTEGYFLIEIVRDPASGTLVVIAYGYWAGGTAAAAWYLANEVVPSLQTFTKTWYIYRWENANADLRPDASDTFTFVDSGI